MKVISPRSCRESARVLQIALNETHSSHPAIINWGNSSISMTDPIEVFGNKREAVARSADKRVMFKLLDGLGTVPVVTSYQGPCFSHLNPLGANGSGIVYCDSPDNFNPFAFNTLEIKGDEYRAYFCYGKVGFIFKKVPVEAEDSMSNSPIHNSHNGWGYLSNPPELDNVSKLRSIISEYTLKAANRLELSYGAVDFIFGLDGYVYILETNSAPTLITNDVVDFFSSSIKEQL